MFYLQYVTVRQEKFACEKVLTGSAGEGVVFPFFYMDSVNEIQVLHRWIDFGVTLVTNGVSARLPDDPEVQEGDFLINDSTSLPGNMKLHVFTSHSQQQKFNSKVFTEILSSTMLFSLSNLEMSIPLRVFQALRSPSWPKAAETWLTRPRYEGWPPKELLDSFPSQGCLILPACASKDMSEWQYSFSLVEKSLFQTAMTLYQKYCYLLVCALCYQTLKNIEPFDVGIVKNVFLYACERIPSEFWQSNPGSCILYILDELHNGVQLGFLPNYFIQRRNMIDHFSSEDLKESECQISLLRAQLQMFLRQIDQNMMFCMKENIIDKIVEDSHCFKLEKNIKDSIVCTFVPLLIDQAKVLIRRCSYESALDELNQAFQDRLSVSTCDDSVLYHMFLQGSMNGLSTGATIWFSTYVDKQLTGQLAKTMIRETCGDLTLVRIDSILPKDTSGPYGSSEVPDYFNAQLDMFCHDYAAFLYFTGKVSFALPVLRYCAEKYKGEHAQNKQSMFDDYRMFLVYSGLFGLYLKQNEVECFRSFAGDMAEVAKRLNTFGAFQCMTSIYNDIGDTQNSRYFQNLCRSLERSQADLQFIFKCKNWPQGNYIMI